MISTVSNGWLVNTERPSFESVNCYRDDSIRVFRDPAELADWVLAYFSQAQETAEYVKVPATGDTFPHGAGETKG